MSLILALRRPRPDLQIEIQASLGYTENPCLNKQKHKKEQKIFTSFSFKKSYIAESNGNFSRRLSENSDLLKTVSMGIRSWMLIDSNRFTLCVIWTGTFYLSPGFFLYLPCPMDIRASVASQVAIFEAPSSP